MEPIFPRINQAIAHTLEYYEIGRIKDYMLHFARHPGLVSHPYHLEGWDEFMHKLHARMEDEIKQTIFTTTPETKVYLFETLKDWLQDHRIKYLNQLLIEDAIDRYNDKTYAEFEVKLAVEVEKLRQSTDFNRPHLEEYEVKNKLSGLFVGGLIASEAISKKINYRYYCIETGPELIDTDLTSLYMQVLAPIVLNFRAILTKYVTQYDQGKIVGLDSAASTRRLAEAVEPPALMEPPKNKIKVNLSVPQLAYLFKMLYDLSPEIFNVRSKADLHRFISENFETKGSDDISINKLRILFSDPGKDEANFWVVNLQKMLQQARKV